MRRELLLALGVLGPFAALVALGFWLSTPEPPAAGAHPVAEPQPSPPRPPATPAVGAQVVAAAGPPLAPPAPPAPPSPLPRALEAPVRAVRPEVRRCFADQAAHLPPDASVRVRFTPTRDGGFRDVVVESSWQDPYLSACVEDVFAEVGFTPAGPETFEPAQVTFGFDAPAE